MQLDMVYEGEIDLNREKHRKAIKNWKRLWHPGWYMQSLLVLGLPALTASHSHKQQAEGVAEKLVALGSLKVVQLGEIFWDCKNAYEE